MKFNCRPAYSASTVRRMILSVLGEYAEQFWVYSASMPNEIEHSPKTPNVIRRTRRVHTIELSVLGAHALDTSNLLFFITWLAATAHTSIEQIPSTGTLSLLQYMSQRTEKRLCQHFYAVQTTTSTSSAVRPPPSLGRRSTRSTVTGEVFDSHNKFFLNKLFS